MKNVKTPISESYQRYLISRLSDPAYAAVYLETHLEETPPDAELLQLALNNVAEALTECPEQLKAHQQQLDEWLTQSGSNAIHDLAKWLNELGLKLTVRVDRPVNGKCSMNGVDLSEISGNVTNTVDQLQQTDRPHASELADLLTQLQAAIESDPDLSDTDKTEALEQVSTLAKAGQDPQNSTLKKLANTAIKVIKGTVVALPATAALVEAVNQLLPTIAARLGL